MAEFNLPPINQSRTGAQGAESIAQELENASTRALTRLDPEAGLLESVSQDLDNLDVDSFSERYAAVFGSTSKAQIAYSLNNIQKNEELMANYRQKQLGLSEQGYVEMGSNALLSLSKLPVIAGETVAAVGNFASGGRLENSTGVGARLADGREWINSLQSPATRASRAVLARDMEESRDKAQAFLLAQEEKNGGNSALDYFRAYGKEGVEGAINFFKNPAAAADSVLESGLIFAIPAAAAAATRKVALSQLSKEAREEFLQNTAKMSALKKQEALAALIAISTVEAGGNSLELQNRVLNMSAEELAESPIYQEALAEGMSHEEAREVVAANTFMTAYTLNLLGAAAVSKALGSDHIAANLFDRLVPNAIIRSTTREFAEEFLQSGGGAFVGNLAIQQNVDPNQTLMDGVASQAGFGAVSGGVSAGGMSGIGAASRFVGGKVKDKVDTFVAPVLAEKGLVEAIKSDTFDADKGSILNKISMGVDSTSWGNLEESAKPAYNAIKKVLKDPNSTEEDRARALDLATGIKQNLGIKIAADAGAEIVTQYQQQAEAIKARLLEAEPNLTETELIDRTVEELVQDPDIAAARAEIMQKKMGALKDSEFYTKEILAVNQAQLALAKSIADGGISDSTPQKKIEELVRILGSNPNVDTATFDKLINTAQFKNLDEATKAKVLNNRELSGVLNSSQEVADYVTVGGRDKQGNRWIGVTEWVDSFNNSMEASDLGSAKFNRDGLAKFLASHEAKLASRKPNQFGGYQATTNAIKAEIDLMKSQLAYMDKAMRAPVSSSTQTSTNTQPAQQTASTSSTVSSTASSSTAQPATANNIIDAINSIAVNNNIAQDNSLDNIEMSLEEVDKALAAFGFSDLTEAPVSTPTATSEPSNTNTPTQAQTSSKAVTESPKAKPSTSKPKETASKEVAKDPEVINVWFGSNQNPQFSNLAGRPFEYEGRSYRSVEHAYQSLKSGQFDEATYNKYKKDGVKIAGNKGTKTAGNWNVNLMDKLVYESFRQNPTAAKELLKTGDAKFTHTQDRGVWRDAFPASLEAARTLLAAEKAKPSIADSKVTRTEENKASVAETKDTKVEVKENTQVEENVSKEPAVSDKQLPFGIKRAEVIARPKKPKNNFINRLMNKAKEGVDAIREYAAEFVSVPTERDTVSKLGKAIKSIAEELMVGVVDVTADTEGKTDLDMISIMRAKPYLFMTNKDGSLTEEEAYNVAAALVKTIYDEEGLLFERASESAYRKILNLDRKERLTKEDVDTVAGKGIPMDMFINSFRKAYTEVSGNKANSEDRTGMLDSVIDSLAGVALFAGMNKGLFEVVEGSVFKEVELTDAEKASGKFKNRTTKKVLASSGQDFVRLTRQGDGTFTKNASALANVVQSKIAMNILEGEESKKYPSLDKEAVRVQNKTASNKILDTGKVLPTEVQDLLAQASDTPARLLKGVVEHFNDLPTAVREIAFGIIPDRKLAGMHKLERESAIEANNSKRREIENFDLFADHIQDTADERGVDFSEVDIFFEYEIWSNGRIGIKNSAFNPQNSKGIRHLLGFKGSEVKVDVSKPDSVEYQGFIVAMSLAMGLKITTYKDLDSMKDDLRKKMGEPDVKLAIKSLRSGDWSNPEAVAAFERVLAKGEGRSYAYQALLNYIQMQDAAKSKDKKEFVSNLTIEIDGKTNGVVLGLLSFYSGTDKNQLAVLKEQMKLGYIFTSSQDSASDVELDHYTYFLNFLDKAYAEKSVGGIVPIKNGDVAEPNAEVGSNTVRAYKNFFGGMARSMVKDVVMTSFYGASLNRIMSNFFEARLANWYDRLVDDKTRDSAISEMKDLIANGGAMKVTGEYLTNLSINYPKTRAQALEFVLDPYTVNVLTNGFNFNNKDMFNSGLQGAYENFMEVRDTLTHELNDSFQLVKQIYNIEYAKALEEQNNNPQVLKAKEMIKRETLKQLSNKDLSKEDADAIKKKSGLRIAALKAKKLTRNNESRFNIYMSKLIPVVNTPWINDIGSNKENFGFNPIKNRSVTNEIASIERATVLNEVRSEKGNVLKEALVKGTKEYKQTGIKGALVVEYDYNPKRTFVTLQFANKADVILGNKNSKLILVKSEADKANVTDKDAEVRTFKELGIELASANPITLKPKNPITKVGREEATNSLTLQGSTRTSVLGNPGVGGVVGAVHPQDGYIQAPLFRYGLAGMSAFDANFLPLNKYREISEITNQGTHEVLGKYNPLAEFAAYMDKINKLAKQYGLEPIVGTVKKKGEAHQDFLDKDYKDFKQVNQYTVPFEGGYKVRKGSKSTEKKAKEVNKGLKKSGKEVEVLKGSQIAEAIKDNVSEAMSLEDAQRASESVTVRPIEPTAMNDMNDYEGLSNNEDSDVRDRSGEIDSDTYGSSPTNSTKTNQVVAEYQLNSQGVVELYDDLQGLDARDPVQLTPEHDTQLRTVLEEVVAPLVTEVDIMIGKSKAFTEGSAVLSQTAKPKVNLWLGSKMPNSNKQSRQEVYVHELIHSVLASMIEDGSNKFTREIAKIYEVAGKFLTPKDFLADPNSFTPQELKEAEALWNYLFSNVSKPRQGFKDIEDRLIRDKVFNDGFQEFVAYGLTNEKVKSALNNLFKNPKAKQAYAGIEKYQQSPKRSEAGNMLNRWVDGLINYVREAFRNFVLKMNKLEGREADEALQTLVMNMSRAKLNSMGVLAAGSSKLDALNMRTKNLAGKIVSPLAQVMKKSDVALVKGIGAAINVIKNGTSDTVAQALTNIRNDVISGREGFIAQTAREFIGRTTDNRTLHNLLLQSRRFVDNARVETSNIVGQVVRDSLHRALTVEESGSMGRATMYTDLSSLYSGQNIDMIIEFLLSPEKRQEEIKSLVDEINRLSPKYGKGIVINTENLGHYMVTGKAKYKGKLMMNSLLIADLNDVNGNPDFDTTQMSNVVDRLATMYSLDYSNQVDLERTGNFFKESMENKNPESDSSGVEFMLSLHRRVLREALNTSFRGREKLVQKGYVKERMNPYIGHKVVSESDLEAVKKQGAKVIGEVGKDKGDTTGGKLFLVVSDAFSTETLTRGIISVTDEKSRGTDIDSEIADDIDVLNNKFVSRVYSGKAVPVTDNTAVPLWDEKGNVRGYRYVMAHETKMEALERLDLVEELMGQHAGNIVDIRNTKELNETAVDHLKAMWESGKFETKDFIRVDGNSKDAAVREMWDLIPEETKDYINSQFRDGFFVRKEDFTLIFGNRKLGLDVMSKWVTEKTRDTMVADIGKMVADLLNHRFSHIGLQAMKDITTAAKDRIVIVSGSVMVANIISNMLVMAVDGINPVTQYKYSKEGYVLIKQFQKDEVERQKLIFTLSDTKLSDDRRNSIRARVKQLDAKLSNNPVTELMDRGLYQTIIDDVSLLDQSYEYPSKLSKKLEPITDRVPAVVKDLSSMVYMTKDTSTHKLLTEITSMSDFLARYATYKHEVTKGTSKEDAIDRAMDNFVNYEAPTHKAIQFLNDIGLMMFTKFFIRIQKVLLRQLTEKPLNTMMLLGAQQYFNTDVSDIFDGVMTPRNAMNRVYTPVFDGLSAIITPPVLN